MQSIEYYIFYVKPFLGTTYIILNTRKLAIQKLCFFEYFDINTFFLKKSVITV